MFIRVSVGSASQLPNQPCRVEGRAARQLVSIEQDNVAFAELAEVIGDARAADTAADDHHSR